MTEREKIALQTIEDQLYAINARNISMRWIGLRKTPTMHEITELNALLGFIIQEIRTLKDTGDMSPTQVHEEVFGDEIRRPKINIDDLVNIYRCKCDKTFSKWDDFEKHLIECQIKKK